MILNIGDDKYIYKKDIVAILNIDTVKNDRNFKFFLEKIKSKGCFLGEEENEHTRSYILTSKGKKTLVYSSIISSKTLYQRNNIEIWR